MKGFAVVLVVLWLIRCKTKMSRVSFQRLKIALHGPHSHNS